MTKPQKDAIKTLVIGALDTLFNRRDYDGVTRFWSSTYIQHSAHIAPGCSTWSGRHRTICVTSTG